MNRVLCSLLASSMLATAASGDELYRQNPIDVAGGLSSQDSRNPGGLGWFSEVSDNFSLQAPATITRVQFWGGYAQVQPGGTQGFMIRIYADNNGSVGSLISTQDVMTFTEQSDFIWFNGAHRYLTTVDLAPVQLPAAGQYWLSVVAILPMGGGVNNPQWGWVQTAGVTPPPTRHMWFGSEIASNGDVSFVIHGTTAPTCGSGDFNGDGDFGTDQDIEAFFACLAGQCCTSCDPHGADFNGDGDTGTDQDIEAFFRALAGHPC